MSDGGKARRDTLFVGALAKGLRVLRAFDESKSEMSLGELSQRTGMDKSAIQRLVNTLHHEGFLDKDPVTRRLRPSHAWLELAYCYYWSDPLVGAALPKLIDLSRQLGETINLAEISGDHIIYVSRLPCKRTYFAASIIGRRLPALSTSAGRAILSTWSQAEREAAIETWPLKAFTPRTTLDRDQIRRHIDETVANGFAMSRDQMLLNEVAIAAPIIGPDGRAFAGVQCSVSAYTWDDARVREEILPSLLDTANSISPSLRG
ncbi:IclR family transcriptional regulator [Paracoccus alkanivorans]|uniref:IclR family transcriptional regulator n=1 Tax=Paracoccus alkanivorans TaxID=2116655 RepID=A0A3M0MF69_9RHOB|nr:IclR family transcriptional regulator [Paracoccus alkanivorans]RMC36209.1 IclR family transcriptional regulator [Paracoccus alkanivorans]